MLALLLGHPNTRKQTISRALAIYDHIRGPFACRVQERARLNGLYFTFNCPEIDFDVVPEHDLLPKLWLLGQVFTKNWEWAWSTSAEGSIRDAMNMLDESLQT
jgi:salicylate hydroxylase